MAGREVVPVFGELQSLMVERRQEVPHTETETDRTKDTWAELKTSALGSVEQLGGLSQRGLPGGGSVWAGKEEGSGNGWGKEWSRLLSLWPEQRADCKCQAEQRNEQNYGCTSHNGGAGNPCNQEIS